MTSNSNLEISGNLADFPSGELFAELAQTKLNGSIRLSNDDKKVVLYFEDGALVFAASNLRTHRLWTIAAENGLFSSEALGSISKSVNDIEFKSELIAKGVATQETADELSKRQIIEIAKSVLEWNKGEFTFSSLARIKKGVGFDVNFRKTLFNFAHRNSVEYISRRISSPDQQFCLSDNMPQDFDLKSHEAFVLSRFDQKSMSLHEIDSVSGLPSETTKQVLYNLWFGGFISRKNWNSIFTEDQIEEMLGAKLRLVEEAVPVEKEAVPLLPQLPEIEGKPASAAIESELKEIDEEQRLFEFLDRVEAAANLYEALGIEQNASSAEVKSAYFAQAKKYHPDLFHKNDEFQSRIQNAFTEIAQAYETLKDDASRELYNFKMRKELADRKEREAAGLSEDEANKNMMLEKAAENFRKGLELYEYGEIEASVGYFARAVHFDPETARFHAYYGMALSSDKKQLHKAESELQTAIRIEPQNITYRRMLAELFVKIGLFKRAEGELTRLLAIAPDDAEALALLDSLQKK